MIIKNKIIPFGDYDCINLFGILFTKKDLTEKEINHENIHTIQLLELIPIGAVIIFIFQLLFDFSSWWYCCSILTFYSLYGAEYIIIRLFHLTQEDAYRDVSFEEEAYNNDDNLMYIKHRKFYSNFKYIKLKSNKK